MKSSKKVLALALAAAMVVTAVPATNAEAATTGVTKSKTCYAGKSFNLTLTTPSSWKSVKTTWTTSKKSVAKVAKKSTKKVKVTGVKAGTATVKVKVTAKKSGKKVSKTYTCKVTVKNPALTLKVANEVAVGATEQITATVKPAGTKVTYTTSDATIATVDEKGVVTGVKDGEVTITAKAGKTTKTVKMTVKKYVVKSVKQTKANTFEAVILGKTSDLKASDVTVTNKTTNAAYAVKSVSVDATDATKVTVETFAEFTDGATYVVTVAGTAVDVPVSDGVVKDVAVNPTQISANTEGTEIKAQLIDKDGIVLKEFTTETKPNNVDFTLSTTQGYVSGAKLVLPVVNNKGTAEVTYHTYKYDANAKEEGVITKKVEIVAVAETAATVAGYNYTIGTSAPADWAKAEKVNTFSISDSVNAYFNFLDSNKKDVTANYSVVSSDSSVLLLPETKLTTPSVHLVAVKAGSAYINVVKDGKVVTSLPVTITDARKLVNFTLGASSVTVSNKVATPVKVDVKAVDQTGKEIALKNITCTPLGTTESVVGTQTADKKAIEISSTAKAGSYTLKVEAEDNSGNKVTRTIAVNVVDTGDVTKDTAKDLRLVVDPSELDLAIASDATNTDKKIKVSVAAYEKGAKLGNVALTSVQFGSDAKVATSDDEYSFDVSGKKAGTYTITVVAKEKTFTTNVTIKNTQAAATVKVLKNEYSGVVTDGASAATMLTTNGIAEFYYNGKKVENPTVTVANDQVKINGNQVYVGTAKVQVKNDKGTTYFVDATVNTVFTLK